MITCFNYLEKIIQDLQDVEERKIKSVYDPEFWTIKMPNYFNLLVSQNMFWQYSSITEEHFLANVDTGDILLFRSRGKWLIKLGLQITRTFTNSTFDHVAMFLRFGD